MNKFIERLRFLFKPSKLDQYLKEQLREQAIQLDLDFNKKLKMFYFDHSFD